MVGVIKVNTRLKYIHEWTSYSCSPYQNVGLVKISEFYDVLMQKYQKNIENEEFSGNLLYQQKVIFGAFRRICISQPNFNLLS